MMSAHPARALAVAISAFWAIALTGCTFTGVEDVAPTPSESTDAPTPAELSQQIFDDASAQEEAEVIGTGTGTSPGQAEVTIDVIAVERLADATLVRMRFSGSEGAVLGPADFGVGEGQSFARTLYLVDSEVTESRYAALRFTDYRNACACPYFPLELGAEPQTVTAVYPPLDAAVTSVDIVANDIVTVADLPVSAG